MTGSLSETLAPPRIATKGRGGSPSARPSASSSVSSRGPAAARGETAGAGVHRGVGPVRGPEGVVHVLVPVGGERCRELGRVPRFARVEPEVLEQEDLARPEFGGAAARIPDPSGLEADRIAQELLEPLGDRTQAERGVRRSPGPSQVGGDHDGRSHPSCGADRRQGGPQAAVVRHPSVREGRVEVGAQQEPPAAQVEVGERQLPGVPGHGGQTLPPAPRRWYVPPPTHGFRFSVGRFASWPDEEGTGCHSRAAHATVIGMPFPGGPASAGRQPLPALAGGKVERVDASALRLEASGP